MYGISLSPGLNNFLIPREEFLNTSFGRGVLENSTESYTNTTASPPLIISGGDENLISSFGASTLLGKLSCYWQNRAVSSSSKTITGCEEAGTAAKTEGAISVLAVDSSTPPANNTGGVPGNPSLETASEAGAAVQAIVTVNVTTTNELQLLLAGLLDNETGGVNGTFESITSEVPFMGFLAPVLGALANATLVTDGLYAAPSSTTPSPTSSSSSVWGWLWDSAAAAVLTLTRGIETLVEIAWTTEFAAWIYLAHLAREALALDGYVLSRSAVALAAAGTALLGSVKAALSIVANAAAALLDAFVQRLKGLMAGYFIPLNSTFNQALADQSSHGAPTLLDAAQAYGALSGSLLETLTGLSVTVAVVVVVLSTIALGPGFLVGLLISAIVGAVPVGRILPDISQVAGFSGAGFSAFWSLLNSTFGRVPESAFNDVATGLAIAADLGTLTVDPLAIFLLKMVQPGLTGIATVVVPVLAISAIAALWSVYEIGGHYPLLDLFFMFLAAASLAACVLMRPYLQLVPGDNSIQNIWTIVTGVAGFSLIATTAYVISGYY